jgi:hypothetical protein
MSERERHVLDLSSSSSSRVLANVNNVSQVRAPRATRFVAGDCSSQSSHCYSQSDQAGSRSLVLDLGEWRAAPAEKEDATPLHPKNPPQK